MREPDLNDVLRKRDCLYVAAPAAGALLGLATLFWCFGGGKTNFEDAALGLNTRSVFLSDPRGSFHCHDLRDWSDCAREPRDGGRRILWLGASQIHGVNEYQEGQKTAAWRLFDYLDERDVELMVFSQPNGAPREHYALYTYLSQVTRVDGLILALTFDDMREEHFRPTVARALDNASVREELGKEAVGRDLVALHDEAGKRITPGGAERTVETLQDISERWLTETLDARLGLESLRAEARGHFFIGAGKARASLAGIRHRITGDWKSFRQTVPSSLYAQNRAALEAILRSARDKDIEVLLYIAPRPTDYFPYDLDAYEAYKADMASLAADNGAHFVNLERVVPNEDFGTIDLAYGFPLRDVFHFKASGHARFAESLIAPVNELLLTDMSAASDR